MKANTNDMPNPVGTLFKGVVRAAILIVSALVVAACCHTPASTACPDGKVPLVSNTTYAVYKNATGIQVEDTRTVKDRCVVPLGEKPTGGGSSSQAASCPTGSTVIVTGTVYAEYFGVADASRQLEDMRSVNDRCIIAVPSGVSACPPGWRSKVIQGTAYCVPAP